MGSPRTQQGVSRTMPQHSSFQNEPSVSQKKPSSQKTSDPNPLHHNENLTKTHQGTQQGQPCKGNTGEDLEDEESKDYAANSRARQHAGIRQKESASEKKQSQKENMRELWSSLPEGSDSMKNIVHKHTQLLLGINGSDWKNLPSEVTVQERDLAVQRGKNLGFDQSPPTAPPSQSIHSYAYKSWLETQLRDLGLTRFKFDWGSSWKHPFNQLMDIIFYRTIHMALFSGEYNQYFWSPEHSSHAVISALLEKYFHYIQSQWKLLRRGGENALEAQKARNRAVKTRHRVC